MVTLTDTDIIQLIRKNNLNADTLEETVVQMLQKHGLHLATAESCTGGLLSERITRVSGASEVFDCGVCSYANRIKEKVLGVHGDTLAVLGAVSAETAIQMAEGVKKLANADIAVSTTGIAGPTGGTAEKPVGLVFVGVCTSNGSYALRLNLGGENTHNSRSTIRRFTSDAALFAVVNELHKLS